MPLWAPTSHTTYRERQGGRAACAEHPLAPKRGAVLMYMQGGRGQERWPRRLPFEAVARACGSLLQHALGMCPRQLVLSTARCGTKLPDFGFEKGQPPLPPPNPVYGVLRSSRMLCSARSPPPPALDSLGQPPSLQAGVLAQASTRRALRRGGGGGQGGWVGLDPRSNVPAWVSFVLRNGRRRSGWRWGQKYYVRSTARYREQVRGCGGGCAWARSCLPAKPLGFETSGGNQPREGAMTISEAAVALAMKKRASGSLGAAAGTRDGRR